MSEKINPIILHDKGQDYVLDFDLESVKFAEALGFIWDEMATKPATMIPNLWFAAFRRYNKKVSRREADELLEKIGGMTKEISNRLAELYFQAISGLISDEDSADERKNAEVTVEL